MTPDERYNFALDTLLKHEGGFTNDKSDQGGATNYGISLRFLKASGLDINLDGHIDITDIIALDKTKARAVYRNFWWNKYKYESIHDLLIATKILDLSVNMGAKQAHILIQRAINSLACHGDHINVDGDLGSETINALNTLWRLGKNDDLLLAIKKQASLFYSTLVESKPELTPFLKGWLRRAND